MLPALGERRLSRETQKRVLQTLSWRQAPLHGPARTTCLVLEKTKEKAKGERPRPGEGPEVRAR